MTEPYMFWALALGLVAGAAAIWFALGRLPRRSDDVGHREREAEAAWISSVVQGEGLPVSDTAVERVIELHGQYLAGPAIELQPADLPPAEDRPTQTPPTQS